ncbi:expressed unknown protein [Seminavis robusta]|uniref:Uncharacterized protein n=1 Tax=Seminavis robusta TaxID=568900 RepID=A0A9N8H6V3_9STRA|nr:expressed unknown protein [Seminavis robusta]|eukprot:Sro158_g071690.1 n/a (360) ;mRNA; f:88135-89214
MVKQSLHEQRKLSDAMAAAEKERAAAIAERLAYQQKLQEIAAAEAAEALEALEATRELARGRGIARLVMTLVGVVLIGTYSFFKEEHLLVMESNNNATNVQTKFASAVSSDSSLPSQLPSLHDYSINMSSLPLPSMEPFDMSQFTAIHLYHVRKAGGSTVRRYLEKVAKHHKMKYSVNEGYCYRGNQKRPKTLMITMVRDPLARAESSYWFEGEVNASNPHSFRDWVKKQKVKGWRKAVDERGTFVWGCASNCLTKWFSGGVPGNVTKAKHVLEHDFHLIIQQNRMDDLRYKRWISYMLDVPGVRMEHKNPSRKNHLARLASAGPTPQDREHLKEINQDDFELLDYILPRRSDLDGYIY